MNKNPLSLSEFKKRGIAMRCKETITVLQFLSEHFAYQTPIHHHSQLTQFKGGQLKLTDTDKKHSLNQ